MDLFQISKNILQLAGQKKMRKITSVSLEDYENAFGGGDLPIIRKKFATIYKHIFHNNDVQSAKISSAGSDIIFHIVFKN